MIQGSDLHLHLPGSLLVDGGFDLRMRLVPFPGGGFYFILRQFLSQGCYFHNFNMAS